MHLILWEFITVPTKSWHPAVKISPSWESKPLLSQSCPPLPLSLLLFCWPFLPLAGVRECCLLPKCGSSLFVVVVVVGNGSRRGRSPCLRNQVCLPKDGGVVSHHLREAPLGWEFRLLWGFVLLLLFREVCRCVERSLQISKECGFLQPGQWSETGWRSLWGEAGGPTWIISILWVLSLKVTESPASEWYVWIHVCAHKHVCWCGCGCACMYTCTWYVNNTWTHAFSSASLQPGPCCSLESCL